MKNLKSGFHRLVLMSLLLSAATVFPAFVFPASAELEADSAAAGIELPRSVLETEMAAVAAPISSPLASFEVGSEAEPVPMGDCRAEGCGNTGTKYGYGNSCSAARSDLEAVLDAASRSICPGIVIAVDINYGQCTGGGSIAECKFSGNADITCKLCTGQSCDGDDF